MKNINDYLLNILNKKSDRLVFKKNIIKIILNETGFELKMADIEVLGNVLKIKTKPILKHKIILNKNLVLFKIKQDLNLDLVNII